MHQEKVQQEKLKAVNARLNFEEVSQHSESGTPSRRRNLRKRLGSKYIRSTSRSPEPRRGQQYLRGWRKVYFTGYETMRKVFSHTRMIQGIIRTTVVADTLKAVTKVPDREEQNLLQRKLITKENPHEERKRCQKGKTVQEDTGSQDQKGRSQISVPSVDSSLSDFVLQVVILSLVLSTCVIFELSLRSSSTIHLLIILAVEYSHLVRL
nr:hypothetical protein [Tanacetum cinerariifolium]